MEGAWGGLNHSFWRYVALTVPYQKGLQSHSTSDGAFSGANARIITQARTTMFPRTGLLAWRSPLEKA
jgi:hypothetical protein